MPNRPDPLADLLRRLEPGKHFLGLWIYRRYHHRKVTPLWTVTFWGRDNEYYETGLHTDPTAALHEADRILNGKKR